MKYSTVRCSSAKQRPVTPPETEQQADGHKHCRTEMCHQRERPEMRRSGLNEKSCHSFFLKPEVEPGSSHCACTHINFGGLGKSPDGVNVVVEDDDSDHHPHAEQHGVRVGEPTAILPATDEESRAMITRGTGPATQ